MAGVQDYIDQAMGLVRQQLTGIAPQAGPIFDDAMKRAKDARAMVGTPGASTPGLTKRGRGAPQGVASRPGRRARRGQRVMRRSF